MNWLELFKTKIQICNNPLKIGNYYFVFFNRIDYIYNI